MYVASVDHLMILTIRYLIEQCRGKDLLPWTIDGTIGIDTDTCAVVRVIR